MLTGTVEPKSRGPAYDARVKAMLDDYKFCITCGCLSVPAFSCGSGTHCFCTKCQPQPCDCFR